MRTPACTSKATVRTPTRTFFLDLTVRALYFNPTQALVDDLLDHRLNRVTVDLPGKEGEMRLLFNFYFIFTFVLYLFSLLFLYLFSR